MALVLAGASALALSEGGCGGQGAGGSGGDAAGDAVAGKSDYQAMCASCHGSLGEGSLGPRLNPWTQGEAKLHDLLGVTMPKNNPAQCDAKCADDITAYILSWSSGVTATFAPRRLRLLNRREYNATVRDLLFPGTQGSTSTSSGGACQSDADCDLGQASCVAASCVADPCNLRTFAFPAQGQKHTSVAVAGSFNGWSTTAADWQMTYVAAKDLWVLKHSLSDNSYSYKLVLDGKDWIADPQSPSTQDDGFGGKNSILLLNCSGSGGTGPGAPADFNPAKDFPVESRPTGFSYDDNADAGIVTSVHVDQYLKAAEALADLATKDLSSLVACDPAESAQGCAEQFARETGKRAFRRPLTGDEVKTYAGLVTAQADFKTGVSVALQVMLSSPYFLYRFEIGEARGDGTYQLTPYEIAGSLSYLFWGTMPDKALFDAADQGELASADGIEKQARRLLADPRSRAQVETFAVEWLGVEGVATADKSSAMFPAWNEGVKKAMSDETRRFVSYVVFDSTHRYQELLTADYTFANATLGAVYGLSGAPDGAVQKVQSPPQRAAGLLGQGSVLSTYAKSDQTSPVQRGLFVRRRLLCEELPPPPAKVPPLPPVDPSSTTRERLSQHTAEATCRTCHQYIDGVGFGFEAFDAIGAHRDSESGQPIDASGDLTDVEQLGSGTSAPFKTLPELGAILAQSRRARDCFATQVYRFATGALESPEDAAALDALRARFGQSNDDLQELLVAVTQAQTFTVRK